MVFSILFNKCTNIFIELYT